MMYQKIPVVPASRGAPTKRSPMDSHETYEPVPFTWSGLQETRRHRTHRDGRP